MKIARNRSEVQAYYRHIANDRNIGWQWELV